MKLKEMHKAKELRNQGMSLKAISEYLHVSKSSVSRWVHDISLSKDAIAQLKKSPYSTQAIEKRREVRLKNEALKRSLAINNARQSIRSITSTQLHLIGTMLYWAEGGKTQRLVRFSNGDPRMITIMMKYFREICKVPENKFRGYIHIHPHLDVEEAEQYWSSLTQIPRSQFFKTYRKPNSSSQNKKNTLPFGVFDIYVLDTALFYKINGWAIGIFDKSS